MALFADTLLLLCFLSFAARAEEPTPEAAPPPAPVATQEAAPALPPIGLPELSDLKPVGALGAPSSKEENETYLRDADTWRGVAPGDTAQKTEGDKTKALRIRLAPLPDRKVAAIPDKRISSPVLPRQAQADGTKAKTVAAKKEDEASTEACKALADQRRHQLEAIESDRKTLAALRDALSDLKLTDKLSFMAKDEPNTLFPVQSEVAAGRTSTATKNP